jgi:hypothetical protein
MLLKAIFSGNSKPQQKEEDHWPTQIKMEIENSEDFLSNSIR